MEIAEMLDRRRPHRADAARNFDAILTTARACFTESGPGVSLEEIARRAGVGIATLYRHFPTRESLVESVYVAEVAAVCAYAGELDGFDEGESLLAWLGRFVGYLGTKRALVDGLNQSSETFLACRDAIYATATPLLAAAQRSGAVRSDVDIDDLMRLIFALTGGVYRDDEQRGRILRTAVRGILDSPRESGDVP